MRRREALLVPFCALSACSQIPQRTLIPVPPESAGQWQRAAIETPPPGEAPSAAAARKPSQYLRASYRQGGRMIAVQALAFPVQASAFELLQQWPRNSGDVTFQEGNVFVVCSSKTEVNAEVVGFARALEQAWFKAGKQ